MDTDVQINANDLITAFTSEASDLLRRAVIAEQKFKAAAVEVNRLRAENTGLRAEMQQRAEQGVTEEVEDPAVETVTGARGPRTRPRRGSAPKA